jgi:hypothetical protein
MGLAKRDLINAAKFIVSTGHPDPIGYVTEIRDRIDTQYKNKNSGVQGRKKTTKEWVLKPKPYIAVIKWVGNDAKVYRILPTALNKTPKP